MTVLLVMIIGCGTSSEPRQDERHLSFVCSRSGDIEACYALRNSTDHVRRTVALRQACESDYRDSCSLLYDHAKSGQNIGDTTIALSAAIRGCRRGEVDLCRKALDFAEIDPDRAPVVENHREELEALLAEHSE